MAEGQITEVVSLSADKQIDALLKKLVAVKDEINDINKQPINLPSDSRNNTRSGNGASASINKQLNEQERLINRIADAKKKEAIESAKLRVELSRLTAENKRQAQEALGAMGAYQKLAAELNDLRGYAKNLATDMFILEERGETNGKQYLELAGIYENVAKRVTLLDNGLKKIDSNLGQHQRKVGEYERVWSGLGNAINQLTREAPAFTYSIQTGFLAISNNLPILIDEINNLTAANKALRAEGKPTQSVLSQIGGALFSWQTLLSLGVTLLTVYGREIGEWAAKLFEGSKALNAAKDSQKALADISVEASKSIVQERLELERNLAIARDTTLSLTERKIAAQNVLDQYPYWFENLGQEAILNGNVAEAVRGVTDALLARAKATAAEAKIVENQSKVIDLETKLDEVIAKRQSNEARMNTLLELQSSGRLKNANSILILEREIRAGYAEQADIWGDLNALETINNNLTDYAIAQSKNAIGLDSDRAKAAKKAKEEEIIGETNSADAFERNISILEKKLALMSRIDNVTGEANATYALLEAQLKILKSAYEALYGEQEKSNEELEKTIKYGTADYYEDIIKRLKEERDGYAETTDQYKMYNRAIEENEEALRNLTGEKEKVKDLHKEVEDFLKATRSASLSGLGFDSLNLFADGTFDRLIENAENAKERFAISFKAITDVAKDTYEFLAQNQQAYFDAQNAQLTRDQKIAESFAHTEEAKQEIAEQYDEKRRELRIAEAKAQKEQAIFNAIINTAQGVTAALAQANIPLSILIGILGAAQVALIAAREIPAFKDGVRNFEGGTALVGDGGRSEIIRTPDGGLFKTPSRDTLVNLPKGSDVFKSEGDYLRQAMREVPRVAADGRGLTQSEMRAVMQEAFGNVKTVNFAFDKSGFYHAVGSHTARTTSRNNLVQHKGISVG